LWYRRHGRDFTWRRSFDLYAVWVSEVMLQQTTTTTVARRFPRFLEQFPTLYSLAAAPEEAVLRAWEGLGYYRRARNLSKAARTIVAEHGGQIPTDPAVLRTLPGLGKYSANAILSFGRNRPLPILEANTLRAWSRLAGVRSDPTKQPFFGELWHVAEALIPKRRGRDFNLAVMDLGSMICTPRAPDCPQCPLREDCVAFGSGQPERFPLKASKPTTVDERRVVVVVCSRGRFYLQKRGDDGRWAGMWEFPNAPLETTDEPVASGRRLALRVGKQLGATVQLPRVRHGVMHFRIDLMPVLFEASARRNGVAKGSNGRWVTPDELAELPLSQPHRKIATAVTTMTVGETRPSARKV